MTIEEELERKTWWVLRQIKKKVLTARGNPFIEYKLEDYKKSQDSIALKKEEQFEILLDLNHKKIISLGFDTCGESFARWSSRMRRKGMIFHEDYSAFIPPSGVLTFTVNLNNLDLILDVLESKFSDAYYTYEDGGIIISKRKEQINLPWIACKCGDFKINKESGEAILNNTKTNFKPGSKEYNLIILLLSDCGKRFTYEDIGQFIGQNERLRNYRDLGFILRNIKIKLGIKKGNNKNIFETSRGYRIKC